MFSDHKKQINVEKHVIKITKPNLLYFFKTIITDRHTDIRTDGRTLVIIG